jgi:hypothetical protein
VGQDAPLTLTMTDRVTEITGTLLDQLGRPAPEYSVVVFSADRSHWGTAPRRISGLVKLATDGSYRVSGLPPGDYVLCVVTDVDASQLNDPSMLEQLMPAGVKLTLVEARRNVRTSRSDASCAREPGPACADSARRLQRRQARRA